ncbi:N-acetylmuramoyl-L-alanine amidase [Streptomyces sp. CAU 1734]|uniref:N-acetylmuramoyl-L-alanine amidase n=1 Tax=Streptomyces sp. CAU 1734 TaxID=3140360 RepID=UPI00326036E0
MSSRRWWGAASVVAAAVAGVLVFEGVTGQPLDEQDGSAKAGKVNGPVRGEAYTAPLKVDGETAVLGKRDAENFSMVGVTWTDPSTKITGKVQVRARGTESGTWSRWLTLENDGGQGDGNSARRGGTEPAWVGPSDGVEVRVEGRSGLPAGIRLDMIDPGKGSGGGSGIAAGAFEPAAFTVSDGPTAPGGETPPAETAPSGEATAPAGPGPGASEPAAPGPSTEAPVPTTDPPSATPPAAPSGTATPPASPPASPPATASPGPASIAPQPPVTARAGWGADESISPEAPTHLPEGKVKAVVVHHTAGSNNYSCEQAPSVVRGTYLYHVQQKKWKDIGYNFLIDKCGTIYEGRKGGIDQPVMGAHAYGFNSETSGVSVLGTYTDAAPTAAALESVARISAWKLGQYGVPPAGTATLTAGANGTSLAGVTWTKGAKRTLPAILGHRDVDATLCPGQSFYNVLGTVREQAGGSVSGLAIKSVTGASLSGSAYYARAAITVNWSATTPAAQIASFELLVDGKVVATTAGTARSAKATLTPGSHKVAVRATHRSGGGRTVTATVIADVTAPTFPAKPALALRTGTVSTTAVPLTLSWKAADSVALKEVRLTSPVARTYTGATASAAHTAKPAAAGVWSLTAYDRAGNTATARATGTPVILQETSAKKSGTWSSKSSTSYLGGKSYSSSAKNASLSWTFTGRSVAWTVSRAATSGQAHIYVDGVKSATVDLKSSTTKYRDAIWTKTWSGSAKHTVKIVVVGTKGRPAVTTDGLVYLK